MAAYVVLECPVCHKQRLYPGGNASMDRLVEGLGTHLFNHHPETPPDEAERYLEHAIDTAEPVELADSVDHPNRWAHHINR